MQLKTNDSDRARNWVEHTKGRTSKKRTMNIHTLELTQPVEVATLHL